MKIETPSSAPYAPLNRRGRLLVVDDQAINVRSTHQIFAKDYDVFMAMSGVQAISFCQKTPPDLVLLDVAMPGMDGLEVCRRLKQLPDTHTIPVIFVTGNQNTDEETACWEAGGVDFVNKPVNPITLRNRVHAHLTLKFQADMLRGMAYLDGLTGIANRRYFDERLESEWRRSSRNGLPLALIMADVDFFKRYNDHYGHQEGDNCLRQIAKALKENLNRPYDLAARYGGEEFVCLLPETDLSGTRFIAATLERAVRTLGIEHLASDVAQIVTLSVGLAVCSPKQENVSATLISRADAQLYRAKQQGRGRVCAEPIDGQLML